MQAPADEREDPIAHRVTVLVVDRLELVDVEEAQGERIAGLVRIGEESLELLLEVTVVAEPAQRIGERKLHRLERVQDRALVERDREERTDERRRQHGRALPQHAEHDGHRGHRGEPDDGRVNGVLCDAPEPLARRDADRQRNEHDVECVERRRGDGHLQHEPADAIRVRDVRRDHARSGPRDRVDGGVVRHLQPRPALPELDPTPRDRAQHGRGSPAVEAAGGDDEDSGQRDAAGADAADRDGEGLDEHGGGEQRHQSEPGRERKLRREQRQPGETDEREGTGADEREIDEQPWSDLRHLDVTPARARKSGSGHGPGLGRASAF